MGLRTPRSQQLQSMAAGLPKDQDVLRNAQSQQGMGVQQAFGQAQRQPGQQMTAGQIQQTGAEVTKAQGQVGLAAQQQQGESLANIGQQQLKLKQEQQQNVLQNKSLALDKQEQELQKRLYGISRQKGQELFGKQMVFKKDELGRTMFNERQLADWKLTQAKTREELAAYEQQVSQLSQRRMKMLEMTQVALKQRLEQEYQKDEQDKNQELQIRLEKAVHSAKIKYKKAQAEAANRAARATSMGSMIGGGIGLAAGIAATVFTGGAAAASIPALMAGGAAVGGGIAGSQQGE